VIDVNNGLDGEGPFSPERSGALPASPLAKLCFSGHYQLADVSKKITGQGGLVAYLGTNDARIVERRAFQEEDKYSRQVYEAMAYQIAKEIGAMATVLKGNVEAIIITGGLAYSKEVISEITKRVNFIAKIISYPGEFEMEVTCFSALRALKGQENAKIYS